MEILISALLIFFVVISILLRILLHRSDKQKEQAISMLESALDNSMSLLSRVSNLENSAYKVISEENSEKISFYRRDTLKESVFYLGGKDWSIQQCKELGVTINVPIDGMNKHNIEEGAANIIIDVLLDYFGREMDECLKRDKIIQQSGYPFSDAVSHEWESNGTAVDESLIYSSKKK